MQQLCASTRGMERRKAIAVLGGCCLAGATAGHAWAGSPVRFILPVSSGSGVDALARAASAQLAGALGLPVVIDNQPGAGGLVGTQALVRAAPDGHTLGLVSNNHVIYPSVLKSLGFDPIADITPISIIVSSPLVIVTRPGFPARSLQEFAQQLKSSPGTYHFGSSGNGTILHLAAELFKEQAGVPSTHVPYRGTGPLLNDLMGGQVDWAVVALPAARGLIDARRLQALGVTMPQRVAGFEQLPTAAEQGFARYLIDGWVAVVGPRGMAPQAVELVHAAFARAFAAEELRQAMARLGNLIVLSTPEAAAEQFKSEMARYAALIQKIGLVAQ